MEVLSCIGKELNLEYASGEIENIPVVDTLDVNGVDGRDGIDIYLDGKLTYRFNTANQNPSWTLVYSNLTPTDTAAQSETFTESQVVEYLKEHGFSNVSGDGVEYWQVTADCGNQKENAVHLYWIIVSGGPNTGLVFSGNAYSDSRIANHGPVERYDLANQVKLSDIGVCVPSGN